MTKYISMSVSGLTCVVTNIEDNLTASAGPGGTIECNVNFSGFRPVRVVVPLRRMVEVRAVPDHGKYLKNMSGTGSAAGCNPECSFDSSKPRR